jgi:Spy/CpxP family protein refolding chaperone
MRRLALIAAAALSLAACSDSSTSPDNPDLTFVDAGAFGTALTNVGGYDAETYQNRLINALPDELELTSEQEAQIKSLIQAFQQSTRADRDALLAILRSAHAAIEAHKSRAEVEAILRQGAEIRSRLAAAEAKLKADIYQVLTPEQRAWIAAHSPRACRPEKFPPLTDAQKAQIRALEIAFAENNKNDLAFVKATLEEAKAAVRAGKSPAEIQQILAKALPAIVRLESARKNLRDQIIAVLTPEQKASGCFPLG